MASWNREPAVIFRSAATNMVTDDNNEEDDIFLRRVETATTVRVSRRPDGGELYYDSRISAMGHDDEFVLYEAAPEPDPYYGLFLWDEKTGGVSRITPPVQGLANEDDSPYNGEFLTVREYGRFVFFSSRDDNLVAGDDNQLQSGGVDIFVRDTQLGLTRLLSYVPGANGGCERANAIDEVDAALASQYIVYRHQDTIYRAVLDIKPPRVRKLDVTPEIGEMADTFKFTADVFDEDLGPDIEFRIDDGNWTPVSQTPFSDVGVEVSGQFTGAGLTLGVHNLCLRSNDTRGNRQESCTEFTIVNARPVQRFSVRCTHQPLLPAPGQNVTYSAEVFDVDGQSLTADWIEIWVNGGATPATRFENATQGGSVVVASGETGTYGCRAGDEGEEVFSGWRLHANGSYDDSHAIPLIKTGEPGSRLDIVFIADSEDYTDPLGTEFLSDLEGVLRDGYWGEPWFRDNQVWFNFWLARETGFAGDAELGCKHRLPGMAEGDSREAAEPWDLNYAFSDSGAIVHRKAMRDCARGSLGAFSAPVDRPNVARHESGHNPFGLADEYCCDGGNYQKAKLPNLWESQEACQADLPNLVDLTNECVSFTNEDDETWWTSDPDDDHMMSDNGAVRAADIRRMNWLIRRCAVGDC